MTNHENGQDSSRKNDREHRGRDRKHEDHDHGCDHKLEGNNHGQGRDHKLEGHNHGQGCDHKHEGYDHKHPGQNRGQDGHRHAGQGHDHGHHGHLHSHHAPQSFNRAFAISVTLNLAFTIFQVVYAFLANSMSLLADAAHNFGDVFGLVLAWVASWLLTLPARKRYSYGFKRTSILAALTNALILVATSALIVFGSIYKLLHLSQVDGHIIMYVALIGIFINGGTALLFMKGAHDDLNIKGAFLHLLGDALISIGVVVAGGLILLTGKIWIDPVVGLIIVAIILWGTWGLLRDSVRLILDAIPHHIDLHGVENYLKELPGVAAVHDLHIWGLSTKEIALTAHLIVPGGGISDADFQKINLVLKESFRIDHATLQVETGSMEYPCSRSEVC